MSSSSSSSSSRVYVVVGASRGIGLALVNELSSISSNIVFAGVRSANKEIQSLSSSRPNLHIITTDLTDGASLSSAASEVEKKVRKVDTLIVNGAQAAIGKVTEGNFELLENLWKVNTLGPYKAILSFLPLLKKGSSKQIIAVSSSAGSISLHSQYSLFSSNGFPYNISKTALNSIIVHFAAVLKPEGFTVVAVCPGVVSSDMGKQAAASFPPDAIALLSTIESATPEQSGKQLTQVFASLTPEKNGSFLNQKNEVVTW